MYVYSLKVLEIIEDAIMKGKKEEKGKSGGKKKR
jgi:hypothetical protein